jgi:WD40 repeat protein
MVNPESRRPRRRVRRGLLSLLCALLLPVAVGAQDIVSSQLRQGFGKNKVRYKDFDWHYVESEHLLLHYEPEFAELADRAVEYLEEGYAHISQLMRHELSTKPPIVIFKSHYEFQQTNIIQAFLPPGVAGFAEPLRYRMVIPFNGDLDDFRNVLVHELMHIFQYDIVNRGPVRRISNPIANPPTWIMEGMAEYSTQESNTIDEMVLRDAVLTDQLIPLEVMDASWYYLPNTFLAYKQSHSIMEYIAANFGPEKVSRILRVWDSQSDTDKLLERLIDMDMQTLDERWQAHMRKKYWPLLQDRDYVSEFATRILQHEDVYKLYAAPSWSLGGDMLACLSSDGVEQHIDIIRVSNGRLVERVTEGMRADVYDDLTFGDGTVAWSSNGRSIAFVGKKGARDRLVIWDLYDKEIVDVQSFDGVEIIEGLDWAPDGQRLAFVGTGYGQSDIYVLDTASGRSRQITGTPQREDHPSFSPDGRRLAYSSKRDHQFDIKVYDFDSERSTVLLATPYDDKWPEWLPTGDRLLFVSTRDGIDDLFLYDITEQREYRQTRTVSGIMNPSLSPDGKHVVLSTYYHGRRELYRMDMPSRGEAVRRSDELAARIGDEPGGRLVPRRTEVGSGPARRAVPDSAVVLADGAGVTEGAVEVLLDLAAASGEPMQLADVSQPRAPVADRSADTPAVAEVEDLGVALRRDTARMDSDEDLVDFEELPVRRYTPKLEFDGIALQMGYYSGFLSGIAQLSMSDLLGNHSLNMFTDYVGSQEVNNDFTFAVGYTYFGRRPTYSATIFNWNQYYNDTEGGPAGTGIHLVGNSLARGLVRSRQSGLLADVSYPLDVFRRIELSYSFVDEEREVAWPVTELLDGFSTHLFKAAYVHDSLRNGLLGPTSGTRYYLSTGRTVSLTSTDRTFTHLEVDYRNYKRLGRWSVLGLRGIAVGSLGRDGLEYNLGGPAWFLPFFPGYNLNVGPLRGFPFSEFAGSRVALLNSEIRVPFIRNITFGWPGTFAIPAVDGAFFFDVGGAWNEDQDLDLWPLQRPEVPIDPESDTARLHASYGFGLLVYFLAPLNFEFARRTDFKTTSDWRMHFSFGKAF